jgi:hypothetical protein
MMGKLVRVPNLLTIGGRVRRPVFSHPDCRVCLIGDSKVVDTSGQISVLSTAFTRAVPRTLFSKSGKGTNIGAVHAVNVSNNSPGAGSSVRNTNVPGSAVAAGTAMLTGEANACPSAFGDVACTQDVNGTLFIFDFPNLEAGGGASTYLEQYNDAGTPKYYPLYNNPNPFANTAVNIRVVYWGHANVLPSVTANKRLGVGTAAPTNGGAVSGSPFTLSTAAGWQKLDLIIGSQAGYPGTYLNAGAGNETGKNLTVSGVRVFRSGNGVNPTAGFHLCDFGYGGYSVTDILSLLGHDEPDAERTSDSGPWIVACTQSHARRWLELMANGVSQTIGVDGGPNVYVVAVSNRSANIRIPGKFNDETEAARLAGGFSDATEYFYGKLCDVLDAMGQYHNGEKPEIWLYNMDRTSESANSALTFETRWKALDKLAGSRPNVGALNLAGFTGAPDTGEAPFHAYADGVHQGQLGSTYLAALIRGAHLLIDSLGEGGAWPIAERGRQA